jgi:poly(3-hydroxybutyrate) depolymerase
MLIALHGAGGQARGFADGLAELRRLADARGWVLVFPQGLENASGATSWAWSDTPLTAEWGGAPPDDVAMLLALIQAARDELGVDPSRVHLAGFSKGGRMAQHFAALHPDRARALVVGSSSVGATLPGDPTVHRTAQPTGAVPALLSHGTADPLLPYAGDADVTPFSEQVERWRVANGCDPTPSSNTSGPVTVETFSGCAAPTRAVTVDGLTHRWSDGGAGFDMSATTFTFFDAL